jgi:adenylate kinase
MVTVFLSDLASRVG